MSSIQRIVGANAAPDPSPTTPATTAPAGGTTPPADGTAPARPELTEEQKAFAAAHPAGIIPVSRDGARTGWRIGGGVTALLGGAVAGIGLLTHSGAVPLAIGGAIAAAGIGTALIAPATIKDTQRVVVASKFDSRREAQLVANSMVGRRIEVIEGADGHFGIADMGPVATSGPRPFPGGSSYYPYDPYYGSGGYYDPYPQYYPGFPDYGWYQPDYGYPSYPSYPDYNDYPDPGYYGGGGTSPGDDY
jgi:hypothetical protein